MSRATTTVTVGDQITTLLTGFLLTTAARELVSRFVEAEQQPALPLLLEVLELEAEERRARRTTRLRRASRLPPGKTFDTLDAGRLPPALVRKLHELAEGDFLADATNVLAFGLPGVGKSHAMCAIGHALVDRGHAVLFMPTYSLVQELLAAKRNLELPRALRKLDHFAVLLLDDVGDIQQSPEEAEILFTLLAERYERRAVMMTSNLIFAQWDRIFRDQMATAAAIDRLVHHSVLLEFDVPSFRTEQATRRGPATPPPAGVRAVTPRASTAQDASGATIASSADLRVDRYVTAGEPSHAFGHVSARSWWPARPTADATAQPRSRSAMEMPAPWTAQNAAHRALEISRPPARFPHSHSRLLLWIKKGERKEHDVRHHAAQQTRPATGQRPLPSATAVDSGTPLPTLRRQK